MIYGTFCTYIYYIFLRVVLLNISHRFIVIGVWITCALVGDGRWQARNAKYNFAKHYSDVIMGTIAFQITSLTSVYSTVYSDAYQIKHQSYASLALSCREFCGDRWIPRANGQWRGKCFHLMTSSCNYTSAIWCVSILSSFCLWSKRNLNMSDNTCGIGSQG